MGWRPVCAICFGFVVMLVAFILACMATAITVNPFGVLSIIGVPPPIPITQFNLNVTMNISVPAGANQWTICQGANLTSSNTLFNNTDLHATSFTPFFNTSAAQSLALYGCISPVPVGNFACYDLLSYGCVPIWGWNPATVNSTIFPSNVGVRFGNSRYRYVVLQAVYTSLNATYDVSGVSLAFTSVLRTYDAGVYTVGVNPTTIQIPANNSNYVLSSTCSSASTNATFPASPPTQVLGGLIHTHSLGKSWTGTVFHQGYQYQLPGSGQIVPNNPVPTPFTLGLFRADSISLSCTYNSVGASGVTTGGVNANQELCYLYLWVYPAVPANISTCFN